MFQFLRQLWHRLCARLRFCGGVQYLAGTASLPDVLATSRTVSLPILTSSRLGPLMVRSTVVS